MSATARDLPAVPSASGLFLPTTHACLDPTHTDHQHHLRSHAHRILAFHMPSSQHLVEVAPQSRAEATPSQSPFFVAHVVPIIPTGPHNASAALVMPTFIPHTTRSTLSNSRPHCYDLDFTHMHTIRPLRRLDRPFRRKARPLRRIVRLPDSREISIAHTRSRLHPKDHDSRHSYLTVHWIAPVHKKTRELWRTLTDCPTTLRIS